MKSEVVILKVTEDEKKKFNDLAIEHFDGNVSALVRFLMKKFEQEQNRRKRA
jgi:hypothetical protein